MFIVIKSEHYDCTNLICKKDTLEEAVAAVKDSMAQRINKNYHAGLTGTDITHENEDHYGFSFTFDENRNADSSEPRAYSTYDYWNGDESKRILWVDEDVTCVKSMNDDYLNRQKAITEKQLSDLSSGIFLQNFDYIVYGKRLASKSENTVEFVENTIVSHNKQELDVVASGMEAMGLSVETGYYNPDDESSVDVPKQLIGFHYVVLKKNA